MTKGVTVDGLFLTRRFMGVGKNRYLLNLLVQVEKLTQDSDQLSTCVLLPSRQDIDRSKLTQRKGFRLEVCRAMHLWRAWRHGLSTLVAKLLNVDTLFLPEPVPILSKPKRLLVTVHDIIPLLFPNEYRSVRGRIELHASLSSIQKADLILTDSEHSKMDLTVRCKVPADRVAVAYLGIDPETFQPSSTERSVSRTVLQRHGIGQPYVLYVGVVEQRKNVARFVNAYRVLSQRRKDLSFQLVLCGRPGRGYEELLKVLRQPCLDGRVILTGFVPDNELTILYREATCFCFPSLYEGFGLPVLEAMASGTPVMSSDRSSLPEVGGDAVLYFNPESEEEISDCMERLLGDSGLRQTLVERGYKRAKEFTWETCARATLKALGQL